MDLLISPAGMLGRAWRELLDTQGRAYDAVTRATLDLTDVGTLDAIDWTRYDTVINCAAWTDVDGAESSESAATAVNGDGVGALAQRCASAGATLVHYSTDYVFAGDADSPYRTDAPLAPLNAYGRGKARGEVLIREHGGPHLILRTSWLYAPWGKNFVRTIAKFAAERESLKVVNDQRGRPTSAQHLAASSLALLQAQGRGTLHVTDGGVCTWFDFASAIAQHVNPRCRVEPCGSDAYPRPAPRPAYSVLDLAPSEALVGPMPPWQENLAAVLAALE